MDLEIRFTTYLIVFISLIQLIVFYYQYRIHEAKAGFGWWMLWNACEIAGFSIYILRSYLEPSFLLLLPQHAFILSGMVFLQAGIIIFSGRKYNLQTPIVIIFVYLALLAFFIFTDEISIVRSLLLNLTFAVISFYNAYMLMGKNLKASKTSSNFLAASFIVFGILTVIVILGYILGFSSDILIFIQFTIQLTAQIVWAFGVIMMLNQRLNTELQSTSEHFKRLFHYSPEPAIITSPESGVILDINEGMTTDLGYEKDKIVGKTVMELDFWENTDDRINFISRLNEVGYCENFEASLRHQNGERITGLISATKVNIEGKLFILSIIRNITKRKELEELLKEEEAKYRFLTENMTDVVWIMDAETLKYLYISPSIFKLSGYTSEEILSNTNKQELIYEVGKYFKDKARTIVEKLRNGAESYDKFHVDILEQTCKNGGTVWTEVITQYYLNEKTGRTEIHGVTRNISERKRADDEIKQKNEELKKLNAEKDKFFSIISHDLRSPFNGILGITKLMASNLSQFSLQEIKEISQNLNKSANNFYRLIENLLEWSRLQREGIQFNPEYFHLNELLNQIKNLFTETARNKNIELSVEICENIFITADKNMIDTTIRNLTSNAIKFTHEGGRVNISAKKSNGVIRLSVTDKGIGMSEEILDNLFRIDKNTGRFGTKNEPGTSLGLILCKEFIEKHGSRLEIKSETGKGSEFYFDLKQ